MATGSSRDVGTLGGLSVAPPRNELHGRGQGLRVASLRPGRLDVGELDLKAVVVNAVGGDVPGKSTTRR